MPIGEYRVGLSSASKAIGYSEKWLRRVLSRSGTTAKALQGLGFSGQFLKVVRESNQGNSYSERTISLDDFLQRLLILDSKRINPCLQTWLMHIPFMSVFESFDLAVFNQTSNSL